MNAYSVCAFAGALLLLQTIPTLECGRRDIPQAEAITGGNMARGKSLISDYGCVNCHTIPGIREANGTVGPPLTLMGRRTYIGGVMTNTPGNMVQWLQDPPAVDPMTAMPNLRLSERDARDIAAYLFSLR